MEENGEDTKDAQVTLSGENPPPSLDATAALPYPLMNPYLIHAQFYQNAYLQTTPYPQMFDPNVAQPSNFVLPHLYPPDPTYAHKCFLQVAESMSTNNLINSESNPQETNNSNHRSSSSSYSTSDRSRFQQNSSTEDSKKYSSSSKYSSSYYKSDKRTDTRHRSSSDRRESATSPSDASQSKKTRLSSDYRPEYSSRSSSQRYSSDKRPAHEASNYDPEHHRRRRTRTEIDNVQNVQCDQMEFVPFDAHYTRQDSSKSISSTQENRDILQDFILKTVVRSRTEREKLPKFTFPPRPVKFNAHKHNHGSDESCSSQELSDDDDNDDGDTHQSSAMRELERKKTHPHRLHPELWYNDAGELNDGPLCRCSSKSKKSGIRHSIYPGEEAIPKCDAHSNNCDRLFHYRIVIEPTKNFHTPDPTTIEHDGKSYYFEGFSFFSHHRVPQDLPACKVVRFNIEYKITFVEEDYPTNFTVGELDAFFDYFFFEIIELVDIDFGRSNEACDNNSPSTDSSCRRFHFLPRFVRVEDDSKIKHLLPMAAVLRYLRDSSKLLITDETLQRSQRMSDREWERFVGQFRSQLVTKPGMKPATIRVDQIDREDQIDHNGYPVIVHIGVRPPQLSYAGNAKYQRAWRDFCKYRHLLANKDKLSQDDRKTLREKEEYLKELRSKADLKRDVTVEISSQGFFATGLNPDVVQHALYIPVLMSHIRFHFSLQHLERSIGYTFKDRSLFQLCLTHPSYRENFGTNPDHVRNTLANCGLRILEFGSRKVHFDNARKRGINMLINIMSRMGRKEETASQISHNERLEFLGDAVVEFLSTIHLYFMFDSYEEGGLATFRAAIVQNQHLAVLAKTLGLQKFMLYAHGSDLCHDIELRHAMANCFEAFMGALFLDGGIDVADRIFGKTLFSTEPELLGVWVNYPKHPLQRQYPDGDRHLIEEIERLQQITKFEDTVGIQFNHIRLLARAFSHRSAGFNNLTLGSNQRMEFLGDTVLQLVASEYLFKFFPDHHEGHLSLLRSSLVNNKTQAVVCEDLGIVQYTHYSKVKADLKIKDRADLLEAFIGALYVDKGLEVCQLFCQVCFFPRLPYFIMNQDWNDPKSKLQQCCLTLRKAEGGEPDIPFYKVIESRGPTNTRIYVVAVYFRDQRLATGNGHSIQEAEMNAAKNALEESKNLFPHLEHQKKVLERNSDWNASFEITKGGSDNFAKSICDNAVAAATAATTAAVPSCSGSTYQDNDKSSSPTINEEVSQ